jgi:hypothetical protein
MAMDKLTELRQCLSILQREMLNLIWGHRAEQGHWLPRRRLHHRFVDRLQVNEVQAALERLGGCIVFETRDDDKDCYALTFLGVLMTDRGPELEELCIRYLEFVRDLYLADPDIEIVRSKEVQAGLGISPEQAQVLGCLIALGCMYSRGASGLGGSEWSAGVPDDVDSFPHCKDFHFYLRRQALRNYEQAVPITQNSLTKYWLRKTGMSQSPPVVAAPSEYQATPSEEMGEYDAFICHASEDKASVAAPLAQALKARGLLVWYDEWALTIGDSLRQSIDRGLARSRHGIVVLSPAFFAKNWPQWELNGLLHKQLNGREVILPVWHGVERSDVAGHSPSLARIIHQPAPGHLI